MSLPDFIRTLKSALDAPDEALDLVFMLDAAAWTELSTRVSSLQDQEREALAYLLGEGPEAGKSILGVLAKDDVPAVRAQAEESLAALKKFAADD